MFEIQQCHPVGLRRLRDEMDRLFTGFPDGSWLPGVSELVSGAAFPAMNLWESDSALHAEIELPGLKLEDIEVLVVGNEITVKGERKESREKDAAYHRRERPLGLFTRTLKVPVNVDADKVEASLKEGVLTITLPKAEAAKPRKISVKCA